MAEYIWRCNLTKQYRQYKKELDWAIKSVLQSGAYILSREVRLFEEEFAKYIGRSFAVAVASGTDALILALLAAGLQENDRVITSTFAPTPVPTAIVRAGGIPVFVDIERDSLLINPDHIRKKASRNTRFIIPVHLFGSVCNMASINRIAKNKGLCVIEDAAQAHGSIFKDKKAGSLGGIGCFSFYPTKNLGAYGDGGMVLTDSRKIFHKLRLLRNYGKKDNPFDSQILGFNSRLDEVQAAVLRVKLRHLDRMNKKRRQIADLYMRELKDLPLEFPKLNKDTQSNYHIFTILCKRRRNSLLQFLTGNNVQANIYYPRPLHLMPAFSGYVKRGEKFPVSEKVSKEALALPLYPELEEREALLISRKIKGYLLKKARP